MSSTHRVRTRTRPDRMLQIEDPVSAPTDDNPFDMEGRPFVRPGEALSQDMAVRTRQISRMNNEYTEEFVLQTLNQLLLARVPKDQIAQRFGVTVRTIYNWELRLREKLKQDAERIDPVTFLGESLEFYKQLRAAGMAMYLTANTVREKQVGLEQARSSHNDMHKFLHIAGFYDNVKFNPEHQTSEDRGVQLANEVAKGARDILAAFEVLDGEGFESDTPNDADGADE